MVTADELAQIQQRMAEAGITNAGAYMRKMALNGYRGNSRHNRVSSFPRQQPHPKVF